MRQDTYEELVVDERAIPWLARRKLKRGRRESRTGIVAYSLIPGGMRAMPWMTRVVTIFEGRAMLYYADKVSQFPTWIDLAPGSHRLTFSVSGYSGVDFARTVVLARNDVLIAGCRTSFTRVPGRKVRPPNKWYLGVVGPEPRPDGGSTWSAL